jgi:hypothetical protein
MLRVDPGASSKAALRTLDAARLLATRAEERTHRGHMVWVIADPPMRWITKADGDALVVVTVLAGVEPARADERAAMNDVVEAYQRLQRAPEAGNFEYSSRSPELASLSEALYQEWLKVEMKRLTVEQARLAVINAKLRQERSVTCKRCTACAHEVKA